MSALLTSAHGRLRITTYWFRHWGKWHVTATKPCKRPSAYSWTAYSVPALMYKKLCGYHARIPLGTFLQACYTMSHLMFWLYSACKRHNSWDPQAQWQTRWRMVKGIESKLRMVLCSLNCFELFTLPLHTVQLSAPRPPCSPQRHGNCFGWMWLLILGTVH